MHIPKDERSKLDSKSLKCVFVGYCKTQKAFRLYDPSTKKIKISRDVIFDEEHGVSQDPTSGLIPTVSDLLQETDWEHGEDGGATPAGRAVESVPDVSETVRDDDQFHLRR